LGFTVGYGKVRDYGRLLKKLGCWTTPRTYSCSDGTRCSRPPRRADGVGQRHGAAAETEGGCPLQTASSRGAEEGGGPAPPRDSTGGDRDSNLVMLHRAQARATPDGALAGVPASPGRARGVAVLVRDAEDLKRVGPGAVAVVKALYPSWLSALAAGCRDSGRGGRGSVAHGHSGA
jgi:hypothetical protein